MLMKECLCYVVYLITFVIACYGIFDIDKAYQTNATIEDLFLDEEFSDPVRFEGA